MTEKYRGTPPKSSLPLNWTAFNGCQETDRKTCATNVLIAPISTPELFADWLAEQTYDDLKAWFAGIGWIEGIFYCRSRGEALLHYKLILKIVETS